jgi:hypothetical protein
MLQIPAENVISVLVESYLDKTAMHRINNTDDRHYKGMAICLKAYGQYHGDNVSATEHRNIHFLFFGGVHVWAAIEPKEERWLSWHDVPLECWKHTSSHDSCWRSDGLEPLSKLYFEIADDIIRETGLEGLAPKDIDITATLGGFTKMFEEVSIVETEVYHDRPTSRLEESALKSIESWSPSS